MAEIKKKLYSLYVSYSLVIHIPIPICPFPHALLLPILISLPYLNSTPLTSFLHSIPSSICFQLQCFCLHHLQAIMAQLPQEEKAKIAEQVESFRQEKSKLDAEVAKWDDNGNDIIVLAKQMCMIMMEMTDFTR